MTESNETQRLIREMHGTIRVLDERSQTILKQAEKTNGRVTVLESRTDEVEKKQEGLAIKVGIGATAAGFLVTTFVSKLFS